MWNNMDALGTNSQLTKEHRERYSHTHAQRIPNSFATGV